MHRILSCTILVVGFFLVLCDLTQADEPKPSQRPNVIVIMADDIGYECYGCYGSAMYQTPVLDDLASRGMQFMNCYAQPICTPSRCKIMTGRSNARNYHQFGELRPTEKTFGHVMQSAGYKTCVVGKWQLVGGAAFTGTIPENAGFDEYCLWAYYHNLEPEDQKRYTNPYKGSRTSRYWKPCLKVNGKFVETTYDDYGPDIYCDYLCDFIGRHQDEPFFVYYPMALVHDPFVPTPDSECIREPDKRPEIADKRSGARSEVPVQERVKYTNDKKYFPDMVNYMDKNIGRIIARLEELGLSENTLVLITGDNGTNRAITSQLGDRTIKGGKGTPTDAGTHVAMFAYWPGVIALGQKVDHLIDFNDFLPTVADLGGAILPDDRIFDGTSFLPLLQGKPYQPHEAIFCHYERDPGKKASSWNSTRARFARDKNWKLYWDGRLVEVSADPLEENVILPKDDTDKTRAIRARLQPVLDRMPWGSWTGGPDVPLKKE